MQPGFGWLSGSCENPPISWTDRADRALMKPHVPIRPGWHCGSCGDDWPCLPAQVILAGEFHVPDLRTAMTAYLYEATGDLSMNRPYVLHARFLGWIKEPKQRGDPPAIAVGSAPVVRRVRW